jgi:hypothetical protein
MICCSRYEVTEALYILYVISHITQPTRASIVTIPSQCNSVTSKRVSTTDCHLHVIDAKIVTLHLFTFCVAVFLVYVV